MTDEIINDFDFNLEMIPEFIANWFANFFFFEMSLVQILFKDIYTIILLIIFSV